MRNGPRHHRAGITLILALVVSMLVAGCAVRSSPPPTYYSISPMELSTPSDPLPVRVARVRVPEYIDNDRIWVREDNQRVVSVPRARWAEPLSPAITRELRIALSAQLTEDRNSPTLIVDIDRLEAQWLGSRQRVILSARWKLDGNPATEQYHWEDERMIQDRQSDTIARAMTDLLSSMRTDIRNELRSVLR